MKEIFQRKAFLAYAGTTNFFTSELLKNLIDYGYQYQVHSKDQLVNFLDDILPDVEFGEIAAFMDDDWLTAYGQEQKWEAMEKHEIRVEKAYGSIFISVQGDLLFCAEAS